MKIIFNCKAAVDKEKIKHCCIQIRKALEDIGHLEDFLNANKRFEELGFI